MKKKKKVLHSKKKKKVRSRRYPAQTFTDAGYADDIALLTNTPIQAESQLHNLEQAIDIGFHVNADKTEYMYYNQKGHFHSEWWFSETMDKFTYLGSSVSSTEYNINMRLVKAWTAIDR